MGRAKALVEVGGRPMAQRVGDALAAAGAADVVAVGGEDALASQLDLAWIPDSWPGAGPLGGVLTALAQLKADITFVVACDLVAPDAAAVATTVQALVDHPAALAAVPLAAEPATAAGKSVPQWLHAAWRAGAYPALRGAFTLGERAIHRAVEKAALPVTWVEALPSDALADADSPADL